MPISPEEKLRILEYNNLNPEEYDLTPDGNFAYKKRISTSPEPPSDPSNVASDLLKQAQEISVLGAAVRGAVEDVIPTGIGAITAGTVGKFLVKKHPVIGAVSAIGSAIASAMAARAAQEELMKRYAQAQYEESVKAREQHPLAYYAGSMAGGLPFFSANLRNFLPIARALTPGANLANIEKAAIANVGLGAGLGAGIEAGSQLVTNEENQPMDYSRVALAAIGNAILNDPRRWMQRFGLYRIGDQLKDFYRQEDILSQAQRAEGPTIYEEYAKKVQEEARKRAAKETAKPAEAPKKTEEPVTPPEQQPLHPSKEYLEAYNKTKEVSPEQAEYQNRPLEDFVGHYIQTPHGEGVLKKDEFGRFVISKGTSAAGREMVVELPVPNTAKVKDINALIGRRMEEAVPKTEPQETPPTQEQPVPPQEPQQQVPTPQEQKAPTPKPLLNEDIDKLITAIENVSKAPSKYSIDDVDAAIGQAPIALKHLDSAIEEANNTGRAYDALELQDRKTRIENFLEKQQGLPITRATKEKAKALFDEILYDKAKGRPVDESKLRTAITAADSLALVAEKQGNKADADYYSNLSKTFKQDLDNLRSGGTDAVRKQSADEVDVRKPSIYGKEVGQGDTELPRTTRESGEGEVRYQEAGKEEGFRSKVYGVEDLDESRTRLVREAGVSPKKAFIEKLRQFGRLFRGVETKVEDSLKSGNKSLAGMTTLRGYTKGGKLRPEDTPVASISASKAVADTPLHEHLHPFLQALLHSPSKTDQSFVKNFLTKVAESKAFRDYNKAKGNSYSGKPVVEERGHKMVDPTLEEFIVQKGGEEALSRLMTDRPGILTDMFRYIGRRIDDMSDDQLFKIFAMKYFKDAPHAETFGLKDIAETLAKGGVRFQQTGEDRDINQPSFPLLAKTVIEKSIKDNKILGASPNKEGLYNVNELISKVSKEVPALESKPVVESLKKYLQNTNNPKISKRDFLDLVNESVPKYKAMLVGEGIHSTTVGEALKKKITKELEKFSTAPKVLESNFDNVMRSAVRRAFNKNAIRTGDIARNTLEEVINLNLDIVEKNIPALDNETKSLLKESIIKFAQDANNEGAILALRRHNAGLKGAFPLYKDGRNFIDDITKIVFDRILHTEEDLGKAIATFRNVHRTLKELEGYLIPDGDQSSVILHNTKLHLEAIIETLKLLRKANLESIIKTSSEAFPPTKLVIKDFIYGVVKMGDMVESTNSLLMALFRDDYFSENLEKIKNKYNDVGISLSGSSSIKNIMKEVIGSAAEDSNKVSAGSIFLWRFLKSIQFLAQYGESSLMDICAEGLDVLTTIQNKISLFSGIQSHTTPLFKRGLTTLAPYNVYLDIVKELSNWSWFKSLPLDAQKKAYDELFKHAVKAYSLLVPDATSERFNTTFNSRLFKLNEFESLLESISNKGSNPLKAYKAFREAVITRLKDRLKELSKDIESDFGKEAAEWFNTKLIDQLYELRPDSKAVSIADDAETLATKSEKLYYGIALKYLKEGNIRNTDDGLEKVYRAFEDIGKEAFLRASPGTASDTVESALKNSMIKKLANLDSLEDIFMRVDDTTPISAASFVRGDKSFDRVISSRDSSTTDITSSYGVKSVDKTAYSNFISRGYNVFSPRKVRPTVLRLISSKEHIVGQNYQSHTGRKNELGWIAHQIYPINDEPVLFVVEFQLNDPYKLLMMHNRLDLFKKWGKNTRIEPWEKEGLEAETKLWFRLGLKALIQNAVNKGIKKIALPHGRSVNIIEGNTRVNYRETYDVRLPAALEDIGAIKVEDSLEISRKVVGDDISSRYRDSTFKFRVFDISKVGEKLKTEPFTLSNKRFQEADDFSWDAVIRTEDKTEQATVGADKERITSTETTAEHTALVRPFVTALDRLREKGRSGEVVADSLKRMRDETTYLNGRYTNAFAEEIYRLFESPKELLFQDSESANRVYAALLKESELGKEVNEGLSSKEIEVKNNIRAILEQMFDDYIEDGPNIIFYDKESKTWVSRKRKKVPYFFPHLIDTEVLDAINNNRPNAQKLIDDFFEWHRDNGLKDDEIQDRLDAVLGRTVSSTSFEPTFAGARLPHSEGLPPSWREKNLYKALTRYGRRMATDLAFYRNVEKNAEARSALGLTSDGKEAYVPPKATFDDGTPIENIGNSDEVQFIRRQIIGDYTIRDAGVDAFNRVVKSLMIQTKAGVRDFIATPFIAMEMLNISELPLIVKAYGHMKEGLEAGIQQGLIRKSTTAWEDFSTNYKTALADNIANTLNKITGREALERWTRAYAVALGRLVAENRVLARDKEFLARFGPKRQLPREEALNWMAARFAEQIQGTYDFSGLPMWTLEGKISPFVSLAKWPIERFYNFDKNVLAPARKGNLKPLLLSTIGMMVGGTIIDELFNFLEKRKPEHLSFDEWLKLGGDNVYRWAAISAACGYAGVAGDLTKSALDIYYNSEPRGFDFPLMQAIGEFAKRLGQASEALKNDEEFGDIFLAFLAQIAKDHIQNVRTINSMFFEDAERRGAFRDLRVFERTQLGKIPSARATQNPFMGRSYRDFKRLSYNESEKLQEEFNNAINRAYEKATEDGKLNPYRLAKELSSLRKNQYRTMPSLENSPLEFKQYLAFLHKTQGPEAAKARLLDYLNQKEFNKLKMSLVPKLDLPQIEEVEIGE